MTTSSEHAKNAAAALHLTAVVAAVLVL